MSHKPFMKWIGGKGRSLDSIEARLPEMWKTYYEPFLGGGAVFWRLGADQAVLSDSNEELVTTWCAVRDDVDGVIEVLQTYRYEREQFEAVRALDRDPGLEDLSVCEVAARMIYLNRTCFNGMYRVNSKGYFNVPFGRYKDPVICNEPLLLACSERLQGVEIQCLSFEDPIAEAGDGDLLYVDPPYVPISQTSDFTAYVPGGFGTKEHVALLDALRAAGERGAKFLLSNSDAYGLFDRYEAEGWFIDELQVGRSVSSKTNKRQPVTELLVRNYQV